MRLFAKFIEGQPLSNDEIRGGLRKATIALKIFPVICGSAFKNKGVQTMLDAVVDYLPSPLEVPLSPASNMFWTPLFLKADPQITGKIFWAIVALRRPATISSSVRGCLRRTSRTADRRRRAPDGR